jgi:hypothetical protein
MRLRNLRCEAAKVLTRTVGQLMMVMVVMVVVVVVVIFGAAQARKTHKLHCCYNHGYYFF